MIAEETRRFTRMEQPKRRHLHVADLLCQHCAEKDAEIELLREKLRRQIAQGPDAQLERKLAEAAEHILGMTETMNAQGKELARYRRLESEANESTPAAKLAREVVDYWAQTHPNANVSPNGARMKLARAAVRLGHTNPKIPCPVHPDDGSKPDKNARCTIADELKEAVDFVKLKPFVGPRGRTAVLEPGCRSYDDLKYALADEKSGAASEAKIEKCRREVRAIRASHPERLHVAFDLQGQVQSNWYALLREAMSDARLAEFREQGARFTYVDGIRTRVDS